MAALTLTHRSKILLLAFLFLVGVALVAGSQQPAGAGGVGETGSIWVGGTSTGPCNPDPGDPNFDWGCRIQVHGLAVGETVTVQVWEDATKAVLISDDTYTADEAGVNVGGGGYEPGTYLVLTFPSATYEMPVPTYTLELDLVNDTAGGFVELGFVALNPFPYDDWNGTPVPHPCGREVFPDGAGLWMTDYTIVEHIVDEALPGCLETYDLAPGDWFQLADNDVGTAPPGFDFQMAVQAPWFPDVVHGSSTDENIAQMAIEQITLGCDALGNYCPDDGVRRDQMASFLDRASDNSGLYVLLGGGGGFTDVVAGSTHAAAIDDVAAAGITVGCNPEGTLFCPADLVTREQMATFLARALGLAPIAENRFSDVVTGSTHAGNINAVAEAGITLGCDPGGTMFCPSDVVTRAQMASFFIRALNSD